MISKNRFILPIILVGLLLTLPIGLFGLVNHIIEVYHVDNPKHLHKFEGKLYYYNNQKELITAYPCVSDNCSDATSISEDEFVLVKKGDNTNIGQLSNSIAIIYDNSKVNVVMLKDNEIYKSYDSIKNYGDSTLPFYIVKVGDSYGAINAYTGAEVLNPKYSYVSFINNKINENSFAVREDDAYYIVTLDDTSEIPKTSSSVYEPIYYYTDSFFVTKVGNETIGDSYHIYDYNGIDQVKKTITALDIVNNVIYCKDNINGVYIFGYSNQKEGLSNDGISDDSANYKIYDYTINDDELIITINGETLYTIPIDK